MKKRLPLSRGTMLQSRYRVLRQLGHGGMGAVYEATDARFKNRSVALKETYADTDETRRAFEREAQLLAKTEHEAFPRVLDYFTEADDYFLVMELIRGRDLADLLRERNEPFEQEQVLEWADQLLDALEDLHANRIIHRDIKPSNLKLTPKGRLKLLDFGIAKGFNDGDPNRFTTFGSLAAATLQYAPLEQVLKANIDWFSALSVNYPEKTAAILQRSTDAPSDLYALSTTLYQLLTNHLPVNAPTRALAIWAGLDDKMLPAHEINPQVSPQVSAFLQKGLELDRKDRFHSACEMREALSEIVLFQAAESVIAQEESVIIIPIREEIKNEIVFNTSQNLINEKDRRIIEISETKKQIVVDLSGENKPEEISIIDNETDELHQLGVALAVEFNQEPIIAQNVSSPSKVGSLRVKTNKVEPDFEPKMLYQYQSSYHNSGKTLAALVSACVITVLCVVIGMATFQQSPENGTSKQIVRDSGDFKPIVSAQTPTASIKAKNISFQNSDSTTTKSKINSSILKSSNSSIEKVEEKTSQPQKKSIVNDAKQPTRTVVEKKQKSKPLPNSDCIFDGKC